MATVRSWGAEVTLTGTQLAGATTKPTVRALLLGKESAAPGMTVRVAPRGPADKLPDHVTGMTAPGGSEGAWPVSEGTAPVLKVHSKGPKAS